MDAIAFALTRCPAWPARETGARDLRVIAALDRWDRRLDLEYRFASGAPFEFQGADPRKTAIRRGVRLLERLREWRGIPPESFWGLS